MSKGGYYDEYWKKNREEINRRRKERYKSDPLYREKMLTASKSQHLKKRGAPRRGVASLAGGADMMPKKSSMVVLVVKGKDVEACYISGLARVLKCSVLWVRMLEKRGVLPKATMNVSGKRVYTIYQIEEIKAAVKECAMDLEEVWKSSTNWDESKLPGMIKARWKKLGKHGVPW